MPRKHTNKGRSNGLGRVLLLTHHMVETPAWRTLPVYERAAYLEFAQLYNTANNGHLAMSVRRLAERLGISENKANWCIQELVRRGFLEITEGSGFNRKDRTATEFRLTQYACDRTKQPPSKAYQHWRPDDAEKKNTVARRERTDARGATVIPLRPANSRTG